MHDNQAQKQEINTEEEALDKIGKFVAPGQVIDYRLRRAREVIDGFLNKFNITF